MKRTGRLMPTILNPDNLRLAFWKARKGKNYAHQVEQYRADLDRNLMQLCDQITTADISVGKYRYFKVFEPKERQICAAAFDEQVLHHALMNPCHDVFEKRQIFDSYASRKNKGTHAALARARRFCAQYPWFLKLDVRQFFASVHHDVLKKQLATLFREKTLLEIFGKIIDSYEAEPDRGLPIGNLTSQYFANHYLVGLDLFIKEALRIPAYVRYMDDMVLWHTDKEVLRTARNRIRDYVETRLRCALKPEQLNHTRTGLPFLGYRLFPNHVRLLQKSKRRFIRKLTLADELLRTGVWNQHTYVRHVMPLISFTQYADAKAFRRKILAALNPDD
jgi:hypothetical protein